MDKQQNKNTAARIMKIAVPLAILGIAVLCGFLYYEYQRINPSTNDAYVFANYAGISAQVSGPIIEIHVKDNQRVKAGDLMIVIDPAPFKISVEHDRAVVKRIQDENSELTSSVDLSQARVKKLQAELDNARDLYKRIEPMAKKNFISQKQLDDSATAVKTSAAALDETKAELKKAKSNLGDSGERNARLRIAKANLARAELNLSYTKLYAPVDGYITNFRWTVGGYVNEGKELFAVVDDSQWWIYAYFRENQIEHVKEGQPVDIRLVTYGGRVFPGKVQGIGFGIFQPDGSTVSLLPKVSPEVDWVKLAQRFPVRVAFADTPPPVQLRIGSSAVVMIRTDAR